MSDDAHADYVTAMIPPTGPGEGYWGYTPVPAWVVYDAIDVLQCHVARYTVGVIPDETGVTTLMIATCRTLAGLVGANAARNKQYGAYEIIEQIDDLLRGPEASRHLEAMRNRGVDADIIDALLALEPRVKAKRPTWSRPSTPGTPRKES